MTQRLRWLRNIIMDGEYKMTNLFFGTLWFVTIVVIVDPEMVGEWKAQRDIAYDSIMIEYVSDMETYK
jgi:hypothetical protein